MNSLLAQLLVAEITDAAGQLAGSSPGGQLTITDKVLIDAHGLVHGER